jgi:hypothetical protein
VLITHWIHRSPWHLNRINPHKQFHKTCPPSGVKVSNDDTTCKGACTLRAASCQTDKKGGVRFRFACSRSQVLRPCAPFLTCKTKQCMRQALNYFGKSCAPFLTCAPCLTEVLRSFLTCKTKQCMRQALNYFGKSYKQLRFQAPKPIRAPVSLAWHHLVEAR